MEKVGFSMRWSVSSFLVFVVGSLFGTSHGQTTLPCSRETISLQTYYMQDISLSFASELDNQVENIMAPVAATVAREFGETRWALASFSDKPSSPSGFPSDHCYREEQVFASNPQEFINRLSLLSILSGRDWEESQMDAIHFGVNSPDIGWDFNETTEEGRWIMRVVMVSTNSGAHVEGDRPLLVGGTDCTGVDYPSLDAVRQLLESRRVYPIIVVPLELKAFYDTLLSSWPTVRVVENSNTYVLPAIYEIADELCATTTAAPTTTTAAPTTTTVEPTTTTAAPTTTTAAPVPPPPPPVLPPPAPAPVGCGDSQIRLFSATSSCADACSTLFTICDVIGTGRINSSPAECQVAVRDQFAPTPIQFVTAALEPHFAVGCNASDEGPSGATGYFTTAAVGSPTGCDAAAATETASPAVSRICCCV